MAETGKKRIRRSPEVLLEELAKRTAKLENRIYKKHKSAVQTIGTAILKKAKFDFTDLTEEVLADIEEGTEKGHKYVQEILAKATRD